MTVALGNRKSMEKQWVLRSQWTLLLHLKKTNKNRYLFTSKQNQAPTKQKTKILPLKAITAFMSVLKPCLQVLFHSLRLGLLTSFSGNMRKSWDGERTKSREDTPNSSIGEVGKAMGIMWYKEAP